MLYVFSRRYNSELARIVSLTLHDTVFKVYIISKIYVIQNNGILDDAVISNKYLFEDHRILHRIR